MRAPPQFPVHSSVANELEPFVGVAHQSVDWQGPRKLLVMTRKSLQLLFANLTISATVHASDATVLSTTRELAKQGLDAYDAGRFGEAVEKLSKAYAVVHVPTLALATARALSKSGKLVAASELYLEATRIPRDKTWQATQVEAQRDADIERKELLKRIARVNIVIDVPESRTVIVHIDGVSVPQALLGAEQMLDPGERHIEGECGGEVVEQNVTVKEGAHSRVELPFTQVCANSAPLDAGEAPGATADAASTSAPVDPPRREAPKSGRAQRILGWATVSVGGVGLALGATTGLLALSRRQSLLDSNRCNLAKTSCPPDYASDVDSYNRLRTFSTVGFIAGGVLTAAGVTLLLTLPRQDPKVSAGLWVSPNSVGVYGGF